MRKTFSDAEIKRRIDNLRERMDGAGVEAVVTTSFHSTLYYSGFWMMPWGRILVSVIPKNGEPVLIPPLIEYHRAKACSSMQDIRYYSDSANSLAGAATVVKEVLDERGITQGKLGIEEDTTTLAVFQALQKELPRFQFIDVAEMMMRQRLVKSAEEIALTRQGAEIADIGGKAFMEAIAEGKTEVEVGRASEDAMEREYNRRFPEWESYEIWAWCQSGPRTMWTHAPSSGRRIKIGDIIILNCGPTINGYFHTLERNVMFEPIPEDVKKPWEVTIEAHEVGIEAVKPGVRCSDVDRAANAVFERAGLLQYRTFGTGHSYGIMGPYWGREEGGELRSYNDTVLQEGMIVSIEPSIYIPEVGGFRSNDMVLVTRDGNEVLTKFPRGILTL